MPLEVRGENKTKVSINGQISKRPSQQDRFLAGIPELGEKRHLPRAFFVRLHSPK